MNIFAPSYRASDPVSGFDGPEAPDEDDDGDGDATTAYLQWLDAHETRLRARLTPTTYSDFVGFRMKLCNLYQE